jgi:hypothetical protein
LLPSRLAERTRFGPPTRTVPFVPISKKLPNVPEDGRTGAEKVAARLSSRMRMRVLPVVRRVLPPHEIEKEARVELWGGEESTINAISRRDYCTHVRLGHVHGEVTLRRDLCGSAPHDLKHRVRTCISIHDEPVHAVDGRAK